MTLAGLSLAYLRDRALNTALNILLLTLSVATLVILVLFSSQLSERFERDARGIDLVVGAKGSPLQLILSSIYQVDVPTGNIPLATVEMLLGNHEAAAEMARAVLQMQPRFTAALRAQIAALGHLGRAEEARAQVRALLDS